MGTDGHRCGQDRFSAERYNIQQALRFWVNHGNLVLRVVWCAWSAWCIGRADGGKQLGRRTDPCSLSSAWRGSHTRELDEVLVEPGTIQWEGAPLCPQPAVPATWTRDGQIRSSAVAGWAGPKRSSWARCDGQPHRWSARDAARLLSRAAARGRAGQRAAATFRRNWPG